jgi:hypothetical protein
LTEVSISIEKSSIPIVWVDTSIVTNMTIWRADPDQLEATQRERIESLYNHILNSTRAGNVVCPAAEQEGEVWVNRDQWLETMNTLSMGIDCLDLKSIQDSQLRKAMIAYNANNSDIEISYMDAFHEDPAEELKSTLRQPFFIALNSDILFGADYNRDNKAALLKMLNDKREENVKNKKTYESQLDAEYTGEIEALIQMHQDQLSGNISDEHYDFNSTWGSFELLQRIRMWQSSGGKDDEIIGFYRSDHNKALPIVNLSCSLYAKIMTDPQPIRSGDHKDIQHISSIMPYSDLFITDKAWSTFLNNKKFSSKYNTQVCYIGDTKIINEFFERANS